MSRRTGLSDGPALRPNGSYLLGTEVLNNLKLISSQNDA